MSNLEQLKQNMQQKRMSADAVAAYSSAAAASSDSFAVSGYVRHRNIAPLMGFARSKDMFAAFVPHKHFLYGDEGVYFTYWGQTSDEDIGMLDMWCHELLIVNSAGTIIKDTQ